MNRNRILVGLAVAVLVGLLAAGYVYKRLQEVSRAPRAVTVSHIVVAGLPLPLGTRLRVADLRLIDWPGQTGLAGSFSRVEDCVDRALITGVVANEPILEANLAPKAAGAGLSAVIPEGMRAVSVRVDDVVAVAGFVVPGTMVDVQVTAEATGGPLPGVTNTILQDIKVLAAGQKVEQDKEGKPQTVNVVTLLVNPEQANKLTMASTDGRIHLALRNTIDTKLVEPPPVYMTSLIGARPQPAPKGGRPKTNAPPPPPPPPPPQVVEVFHGDRKDTAMFPSR